MDIFRVLADLLSSSAIGNLALLIAAFVGVYGNYWLYRKKRQKRAEALRRALYSELSGMEPVIRRMEKEHDAITMDPIDPRSFLVKSVYQSSSDDLGLLNEEEVSAVVDFYSTAISIQRIVGDEFSTAYEQVSRRDLYTKLNMARGYLRVNGEFRSNFPEHSSFSESHYSSQKNHSLRDTLKEIF